MEFYVVGVAIPNDAITARLSALYSGATFNLLTGIADEESDYRQFAARTLYGVNTRWPLESYDGGSHIGLMMVPVTFTDAWDWIANTQKGAEIFADKLATAGRIETAIRTRNPGLRVLTSSELEHMALVLYGPHGSADRSRQYYVPAPTPSGIDWIRNTIGNQAGVEYANRVLAGIHQ
jgi:hypothetical protein